MRLMSGIRIIRQMLFENFGDLYRNMKKYDAAAFYFKKAMDIAVAQYGERNDEVADIYRMQGQLFMDQMLFESAVRGLPENVKCSYP